MFEHGDSPFVGQNANKKKHRVSLENEMRDYFTLLGKNFGQSEDINSK